MSNVFVLLSRFLQRAHCVGCASRRFRARSALHCPGWQNIHAQLQVLKSTLVEEMHVCFVCFKNI